MLVFVVMLLLFALNVPIAFAMFIGAFAGVLIDPSLDMILIAKRAAYAPNSFAILAIPFFMLAGELMNESLITERIFAFARSLIGHFRGGLGYVNILASMIFAGMSGSGLADASGLGRVEIKAMLDEGYDRRFSAVVTAASNTIGPIIPPSIPMVLFGVLTNVSVGKLLLGGLVPGILMGLFTGAVVWYFAERRNYPIFPRASGNEVCAALVRGFWPLLTPVIIVGGMISGIFTPTEAAVVAVLYASVMGIGIYRTLNLTRLYRSFVKVGVQTAALLFIIAAASSIGLIATHQGLADQLARLAMQLTSSWVLFTLLVIGLVIFLGCFMEDLSILIILGPILLPVAVTLGMDSVHFGVVFVYVTQLGMITPPVGVIMYVVCDYARISMAEFTRESIPFTVALIFVAMVITLIPPLVIFVPNLFFGR
ncbi:MAG TPA: TRAP transporter large permease [archaeon]|nr:TRAP transporter large permease [archaeon]